VVPEVLAEFEKDWTESEPVTQGTIDQRIALRTNIVDKQRDRSLSRSVSRTLSVEFEEAR
jgi:hypothetical protein